jgi:hypothetical protein
LEQHPDLFDAAMVYEKEGYSWMEEPLQNLKNTERVVAIKKEHYIRMNRNKLKSKTSTSWQDEILSSEGEGCASCFI